MSRNLSVTEPHPSVPKGGAYIGGGRGGAGNFRRYKAEDLTVGPTASGPAARISLSKPFKRQNALATGRGGAGNMFKPSDSQERVFQFDEEMMKKRDFQAPVYHIGRGGAANWVDERPEPQQRSRTQRIDSTSSMSSGSDSSEDVTNANVRRSIESAFNRLTRKWS